MQSGIKRNILPFMPEPEINTERNELFARLFAIANNLQAIGDRHLGKLTTKQWFLIACVGYFEPGQPSLSDLVPVVGSSRQNIKQLALKLEQQGLPEHSQGYPGQQSASIVPD